MNATVKRWLQRGTAPRAVQVEATHTGEDIRYRAWAVESSQHDGGEWSYHCGGVLAEDVMAAIASLGDALAVEARAIAEVE